MSLMEFKLIFCLFLCSFSPQILVLKEYHYSLMKSQSCFQDATNRNYAQKDGNPATDQGVKDSRHSSHLRFQLRLLQP